MSHLNSVGGTSEGNLRPMRGNPIVRGFVDLTKSGYQALRTYILFFFFFLNTFYFKHNNVKSRTGYNNK